MTLDPWSYSYLGALKTGLESLAVASMSSLSFNQRKMDSVEAWMVLVTRDWNRSTANLSTISKVM